MLTYSLTISMQCSLPTVVDLAANHVAEVTYDQILKLYDIGQFVCKVFNNDIPIVQA